jgi:hypothetical protein
VRRNVPDANRTETGDVGGTYNLTIIGISPSLRVNGLTLIMIPSGPESTAKSL